MFEIVVLDAKTLGDDANLSLLEKYGSVEVYKTTLPGEAADRLKGKDIIVTNKVVLNEANLKYADCARLICIAATRTNNIDIEYARSRNIAVANVAGYSTGSVVQHTFSMLFYLLGHMRCYDEYVKSGAYSKSGVFTYIGESFWELKGKTWGIIGLGTIGRSVAVIAEAFGCDVAYYSTSGKNNDPEYRRLELEELLKASDVVSIHAPLNQSTRYLIDYERLKKMKKNAVLLNLGRGGIVNEKELAAALDEGLISGAGLDVLECEPIEEDNPLLKINNSDKLLITPHNAWASIEARSKLISGVAENIGAFIKGEKRNRIC